MFTGIVDHLGTIVTLELRDAGLRVQIESEFCDCQRGESIAVDGVCLTVTDSDIRSFWLDLSAETLACTAAATWQIGQRVHLERALRVGDRLGGHWVTGHVDGCVQVKKTQQVGDCLFVALTGIQPAQARYLVDKGSVSLDGVSLTVNQVTADGFEVMLIPQTLVITHFDRLKVGDLLHVEYDYLLKWAARNADVKQEAVV